MSKVSCPLGLLSGSTSLAFALVLVANTLDSIGTDCVRWLIGRDAHRHQIMALNYENLLSLAAVIRDVRLAPDNGSVQFKLVGFSTDVLREIPAVAIDCSCPVVAGLVVLRSVEMQSNGAPIPDYFLPANLERTLTAYLQAVEWKIKNRNPQPTSKSPATADELLTMAAQRFINAAPGASGFEFGQAALDKFNAMKTSHANA